MKNPCSFPARVACLLAAALSPAAPAAAITPSVWTVTETKHVLRSEPPGRQREARLAAARNEWVSFQILVRSDAPARVAAVTPGELRGIAGRGAAPVRWRLYRQHQLHLESGTHRNAEFKVDWYPDPLIPFEHPLAGEHLRDARFMAIPFDLPGGETHGFWVDLYVPANAAAGEYRGACRVALDQVPAVEIPVILTVWDFVLPPVPALETEFGSPAARLRSYYRERAKSGRERAPENWAMVETQCVELVAEHRLNAVPPAELLRPVAQPDGTFRIPVDRMRALGEFAARYRVNSLPIPHPSSAIKDPELERNKLHAWLAQASQSAHPNRPAMAMRCATSKRQSRFRSGM